MKKIISLLLCVGLVMTMFTACGSKGVKTGLAVVTTATSSKDATAESDGLAQVDSTAVAVLVDSKGVIQNCAIDVIQTRFNFNAAGEITTELDKTFVSKKELGDAYDMRKASPIGKEWYEQAEALEKYVIGKTLDQVKGIAIDDHGYVTDEDLASSVTINIASIISAIEKAVNNAKDLGAKAGDKLGLGLISGAQASGTKNASAEGDGSVTAYTHYGVITLDKNGKITSSIIDASQSKVFFNAEGKITSDLTGPFETKIELGDRYNMRSASGIGKEWFEQSEAFCNYMKGKKVADITGLALDGGKATDKDLVSSVTITITDFLTVVDKAAKVAK
ncbi:hypothetical protein DFR55_1414 [Herbinix hemicellulosilytica]|uniref:Secreted protein n=1 Tax=Herbinix hemicellulosilytica TaxID=1564487 RepID=A0A0H5SY56_HERHM|nr:hypothetical protein [Herbinix hemicellulosilytica]RBP56750.1 hypothetical protein DFR55_1414 [Herbinix hemicellulosilytica]CRZ35313.1 hypothetical protein HHT355_2115 [Herbinix hemicellulosilytica]